MVFMFFIVAGGDVCSKLGLRLDVGLGLSLWLGVKAYDS